MSQIMDNIFWIAFVGFMIISAIFNAVGEKLKKAEEAAKKSRDYQEGPKKFNPFGNETAEDFFERISEKEKPKKKLKLAKEREIQPEPAPPAPEELPKDAYILQEPPPSKPSSSVRKKRSRKKHKINLKDRESIRKAIIINEVLNPPKAYKL